LLDLTQKKLDIRCKNKTGERKIHTFPIARNPLSKKNMIPRKENNTPNPVKPNPISDHKIILLCSIRGFYRKPNQKL
jgi:hypothetical protein